MKRIGALANLAVFFVLHWVRAGVALCTGTKRDARAFRAQFAAEGIFPLTPAEQESMPRAQACIVCGLCDMGTAAPEWRPYGREALAAGFARALPVLPLPAADVARAADRREAGALCPMGVPLATIADYVTRPRS